MIRKRAEAVLVTGALLVGMLSGCSKPASGSASGSASQKAAGSSVTVKFWSAPQKVQYNFWVSKAKAFNATNPKINGKNVTVKVQEMPESPSSEAGIQNAIVTGTVPAASENISRSFAATLANSNALYNIENDKWYQTAVAEKKAGDTMKEWAIGSKQYVLPEYVNPMTWQWNSKALKALGFSKVPETMDDLKAVLKAFTANKAKMQALGVTHTLYRPALLRSDQWWERWYDFQGIYMALSQKTSWVEKGKLTLDRQGTIDTFQMLGNFGNTIQTNEVTDVWTSKTIPILMSTSLPWDIQTMQAAGKKYGLDGDYIFGPSLVKKAGDTPYNFGDSKGIVLYKNSSISNDQHQGAVAFLQWMYSDKNCDQTDADWLAATTMLPVRGDTLKNSLFAPMMKKYPELKDLAGYSVYSIPCMASEKMTDIQTSLGESGLVPYIQKSTKQEPLHAPDASADVDNAIRAMKSAGSLS